MQSLKDIVPAAENNINTKFIVLEKGRIALSQKNKGRTGVEEQQKTCLALVADETAAVQFQMWGDECDAFEPGDIIRLENGIFSYLNKKHVLRAGWRGKAEKMGEFTMAYVEKPNMSELPWTSDPKTEKFFLPTNASSIGQSYLGKVLSCILSSPMIVFFLT
ncbi:putative SOSS complex subunit B -like protein isoform X2 [Capsicum annuum]|nr:putative SOSS complex subunit B -like protein isoform X2 [Capsicum annuum]